MLSSDVDGLKKSLSKFASKLSETRRVLRLFDDLPMLKYSLHYGFGEVESVSNILIGGTVKTFLASSCGYREMALILCSGY